MKALALIVALLSVPAFAADNTPWPGKGDGAIASKWVDLAQQQPQKCCKHCTKGKPRGNTCISAKSSCKSPSGCAC